MMKRNTSPNTHETVCVPSAVGVPTDELPPGTFKGEEELPPGTFHGEEELPPGCFHCGEPKL